MQRTCPFFNVSQICSQCHLHINETDMINWSVSRNPSITDYCKKDNFKKRKNFKLKLISKSEQVYKYDIKSEVVLEENTFGIK